MEIGHAQTQPTIGFESSVGSEHYHAGGFVGVFPREYYFAVINSARVGIFGIVGGTFQDVVPFEDVGFVGHCDDFGVGKGIFVEGLELALETLGGEWGCHFGIVSFYYTMRSLSLVLVRSFIAGPIRISEA